MTDANSQPEYTLIETGSSRQRLKVKLTRHNGFPLLDLRFWFKNNEGAWCPTKKGISLSSGRYGALVEALARHTGAIQAWLNGDTDIDGELRQGASDNVLEQAMAHRAATTEASERARFSLTNVDVHVIEDSRVRFAFDVEHRGGTDRVLMNRAHPFARQVEEATTVEEMRALLLDMVATHARARQTVAEEEDEGLLRLLDQTWSERLRAVSRRQSTSESL